MLDPLTRRFTTLVDARAHLDELVSTDWFGARWPDQAAPVLERRGRGATWSLATSPCGQAGDGRVLLADLDLAVLLHELAHLCRGVEDGHDDRYVATLLVLVRREMGAHAYGALRSAVEAQRRWPHLADELAALEAAGG